MSLVADYDSDSDTSSDCSSEADKTLCKPEPEDDKKLCPGFKLPAPQFSAHCSPDSVFGNPFLEAETAKEAILEKHVKMVDTKDAVVINGKRICWNYRKGRCRFGHNCKYAHDSDLQKSQEQLDAELDKAKARSVVCQSGGGSSPVAADKDQKAEKRKRPGLTQGLVPGKRVMKQYRHGKS